MRQRDATRLTVRYQPGGVVNRRVTAPTPGKPTMPDAGLAFALVASCLLFAFMAGGLALALKAKAAEAKWALDGWNRAVAINAEMKGTLQDRMDRIHDLTEQLRQARKNDHRDDRGGFARAG